MAMLSAANPKMENALRREINSNSVFSVTFKLPS
jgi:hypothetical protein